MSYRKWLAVLVALTMVFSLVPFVGAEVVDNNDDNNFEQLFLSNGGDKGNNGLYEVELFETYAELTLLYSFDNVDNFDFVTHIGGSADGATIFVIGEDSGHLGAYSIADETFEDLGEITNYPEAVTQVAGSPDGILYMVCKETDRLFTVDVDNVEATYIATIDIDVQGADIAFGADGTLYLYSAGSLKNLYTVDIDTGTTTFVGNTGAVITGLAIREGGIGDLVGSDGGKNEFIIIDKTDGTVVGSPLPMQMDGEIFNHTWGDMATGYLIPDDPPTYGFCGYKYVDGEPAEGWVIELEVLVEDFWETYEVDGVPLTAETGPDGKYCFEGLPAGTYRASEVQQDGFTQVFPENNEHIIVLPLEEHVIYGVEQASGDLYTIDLLNGIETFLASTGNPAPLNNNSPNGLAYDIVNQRLYFGAYDRETLATSDLYFYDVSTDQVVFAGVVEGITAGAGFGNGAYWYIKNATDDLYKVTFDDDGKVLDNPLLKANITGADKAFRFGDLAISPSGELLYGSSLATGVGYEAFFSVELEEPYTYNEIKYPALPAGLQLAYGSDGSLYGHSTGSQDWYYVDIDTGDFTLLGVSTDLTRSYTDLAQGQSLYNFYNETDREPVCETAWAKGTTSVPNNEVEFEGAENPSNAWGWTNLLDKEQMTVTDNVYSLEMDLWAAAGQNETDNGYLVGSVRVEWEGDEITVTYLIYEDLNCWFSETHLWIGGTKLPLREVGRFKTPTPTSAPGQFLDSEDFISYDLEDGMVVYVFDASELRDEIWIAAHAVVCCYDLFEVMDE